MMLMPEISNREELQLWMSNRPARWIQVIGVRVALRALPYITKAEPEWLRKFADTQFRALNFAWAFHNSLSLEIGTAYDAAGHAAFIAFNYSGENYATNLAIATIEASAESITKIDYDYYCINIGRFADFTDGWNNINKDCEFLWGFPFAERAAEELSAKDLRHNNSTYNSDNTSVQLATTLLSIDPNYSVWLDWYDRRIRGERAAFDIPGDQNRAEDKAILVRLAEATNEDFWDKGHEYVNATLKGWLDEARARAALPPIVAVGSGTLEVTGGAIAELGPMPPPQNRNAISFKQDEDGQIAIDASALVGQLRTDTDARDRHAEAISEARGLLNRCLGNNAAARLTQRLENYLDAAGTSVEDIKPSLIVHRGERLRQELAAYAVAGTMLDPLADDILVDLNGWQSAHNMLVGLDPVLMAIDTSMAGPNLRPELMSPDEIRQFVNDANEAELLAPGTAEILIETADLAPTIPDSNDRSTNASTEMVRNLCIETVSIVLNHPVRTGIVVAVSTAACSSIVAGAVSSISTMGSIKAAEYLVTHRQWIEEKMGNTPTWQALFAKVADWLEKNTPFEQK